MAFASLLTIEEIMLMKKIRVVYYIIKQSLKSIWKNLFMVLASVLVVFAVLSIFGVILVVSMNINDIMNQIADRPEVQINFEYFVTEETAKEYMAEIEKDYRVKSVKFVSKEENLNNLLEYYKDEAALFDTYKDSERLKYVTIEVQLNAYQDGESFVAQAKQFDGVDNVKDITSTVTKMEVASFWMKICTAIAIVLVLVLSLLLIFNTVKLAVLSRKREIEISKYIGATDAYISAPFLTEGVFTGILGAIISYFAIKITYTAIYNSVTKSAILGDIKLLKFAECGGNSLLVIFLLFGIVTGFIASYIAVQRYIDV